MTPMRAGTLELHAEQGLAVAAGRALSLSTREAAVLAALMDRPGQVLSREELYARVWRRPFPQGDRSVDVYVHRLREKLTAACPGRWIHTHTGFGYRLEPPLSPDVHNVVTSP